MIDFTTTETGRIDRIDIDGHPWSPGPWDAEPDYAHWVDEATGLDCLVNRNDMGAWCGYVGVKPGHPLHGIEDEMSIPLDAHGGITYSAGCSGGICHAVEGDDHVWWVGFDCLHSGDAAPRYVGTRLEHAWDTYRDLPYVLSEVVRLAAQVKDFTA